MSSLLSLPAQARVARALVDEYGDWPLHVTLAGAREQVATGQWDDHPAAREVGPRPREYTPPSPAELAVLKERWALSREDMATLLCVHTRSVAKWLSGERDMSYPYLATLARRAAGVDVTPGRWREELGLAS